MGATFHFIQKSQENWSLQGREINFSHVQLLNILLKGAKCYRNFFRQTFNKFEAGLLSIAGEYEQKVSTLQSQKGRKRSSKVK